MKSPSIDRVRVCAERELTYVMFLSMLSFVWFALNLLLLDEFNSQLHNNIVWMANGHFEFMLRSCIQ